MGERGAGQRLRVGPPPLRRREPRGRAPRDRRPHRRPGALAPASARRRAARRRAPARDRGVRHEHPRCAARPRPRGLGRGARPAPAGRHRSFAGAHGGQRPGAAGRRGDAPAVDGRGLRRLLLLRAPRRERRRHPATWQRAAATELEAPADRLPRARRDRRRLRHRRRTTPGPAQASWRGATGLRAVAPARRRGRGRLRRRYAVRAGHRRALVRLHRPRVRRGAAQRLVRAGRASVGVRAARPVPREVLRHQRVRVGDAARGADARAGGRRRTGPAAPAVPRRRRPVGPRPASRARARAGRSCRGGLATVVRPDVLDTRPAARPPHGQRRVAAHR